MLSSFFVFPPKKNPIPSPLSLLTNQHTPISLYWHPLAALGHKAFTGPRASPPIDVQQGHPLLHIQLEPWVPPCVLLAWCLSPWELWGVWLADIPMGLQTPSTLSVFSLIYLLGTLHSVQLLAVSICLCICKALAEEPDMAVSWEALPALVLSLSLSLSLILFFNIYKK